MIEWLYSLRIDSLSLCIALLGVIFASWQIRLSRIASAHSTVISLTTELKNSTDRLGDHQKANRIEDWKDEVTHLMNLLEFTCAVIRDGAARGHTGKFLLHTASDITNMIDQQDAILLIIKASITGEHSFDQIFWFVFYHKFELKNLRLALTFKEPAVFRSKKRIRPWDV